MTPDTETRRRLALVWGAISEVITSEDNALLIERNAITAALQAGHIKPGQPVVITAGIPFHVRGTTNLIKVATAEWY
jgi:pyruvate kinase